MISSKAFGAIARIGATVILARTLSKEDFGVVSFALITYIAVSTLASLGLPDSVYYFFEKYPNARRSVYRLLAKLLLAVAAVGAVVLVSLAYAAEARGYDVTGMLLPLTLLLLLDLPAAPVNHALIATGHAKLAAVLNVLFSSLLFFALILPPLFGLAKEFISYSFLGYGLIRLSLSLIVFSRHVGGGVEIPANRGSFLEILRYAVPLGIANITWKMNQFIDKYIVMLFLPVAIFAEYSVGAWEFPVVPIVASSVAMVMMPQLVGGFLRDDYRAVAALWKRSVRKISLLVAPAMVLLVLASADVIVTFFSENYAAASLVFAVYSLGLLQRVCDNGMLLRAIDETGTITRWAAYTLVLNFCFSVPLVLWMGMVGAALATLCAGVITWFYALGRAAGAMNLKIGDVFPFRFCGHVLVTATVAALPVIVLQDHFPPASGVALAWKSVVYVLTYALISTLAGLCNRQDWMFMGRLVGLRSQQAGY